MRHKIKIDLESPLCSLCEEEIETLDHIFLHCKHTTEFIERVNQFINSKIDRAYRDTNLYYRITLAHTDNRINFFNAVANWFISKKFQSKSPLIFPAFINEVKLSLLGEKVSISSSFRNIFSSQVWLLPFFPSFSIMACLAEIFTGYSLYIWSYFIQNSVVLHSASENSADSTYFLSDNFLT